MQKMNEIDLKIIKLLSLDAKRSLADIGGMVDLSPSSVKERIRRLIEAGVIRRFTVDLDPVALGAQTLVFVWIALRDDADEEAFRHYVANHPLILECHHVTGAWSYLIKLRVGATPDIENFLANIKGQNFLSRSETVITLSSPVAGAFVQKEVP
ncbi:Lrp/AsnC family transcriptional regulator [Nitrincola sp. MINF-07-Sa-05]|uniref:Lrp/AsnC family transcriptional regulator n=1 Tax=Nitrincola salilacus TaxID=3400273 RepID=UPI003917FA80